MTIRSPPCKQNCMCGHDIVKHKKPKGKGQHHPSGPCGKCDCKDFDCAHNPYGRETFAALTTLLCTCAYCSTCSRFTRRCRTHTTGEWVLVEYRAINSGGSWWLDDKDWKALEKAGWTVMWATAGGPGVAGRGKEARYMGALASTALVLTSSLADAIRSWEKAVGQDSTDEGCNCCGPPHCFSELAGGSGIYTSGDETVAVLYGDSAPKSLREAAEREAATHGGA